MSDWKIQKREERCARCQRAFEEGERFYSLLIVAPDSLGREDRCPGCFEAGDEGSRLVFWRTRRRPDRRRGLAVDFDSIERLFHALEGRPEPRLAELRHLLSLLLMRKKRLKLVRVRRTADAELMVLRRPRRTEELEVQVFDLTPERTAALRADLERIIEGAGAEDLLVEVPGGGAAGGADSHSTGSAVEVDRGADRDPGGAETSAPAVPDDLKI